VRKDKISGVSQKGPFVKGSTATLYELDSRFAQTGRSFRDIIADDKGSFEIKNVELVSPYAMLEADGFYRNEVTGKISTAPIKLYAIADVREKDNINVNLLTHLEYFRIQKLVEGGKSLKDAKKQAQGEILAVFGISGEFANSEDMSIFGTSESDAILLAISVLMQSNLSEGEFTERLTDFSLGFRETGVWNNETAKTAMADWAVNGKVVDNEGIYCYYGPWDEQSQTGGCRYASRSERDRCESRGGILVKDCSDDYGNSLMENIKSKILDWGLSSAVPDFVKYVRNYWYVNYGLGICNSSLQGNIKNNPKEVHYICKDNAWVLATEYDRDIYQWVCTEGEFKNGQISDSKYICKNQKWLMASYIDVKCSESNSCLTFKDARDNQSYVYVVIGEQTWMAQNLNYNANDSKCYENSDSYCNAYGRLYELATAKTACPTGWHLPAKDEWDILTDFVGGFETGGKHLKATSGWNENENGNGLDTYGFAAIPGGNGSSDYFGYAGEDGYWWNTSICESDFSACRVFMSSSFFSEGVGYYLSDDGDGSISSVRCVKD
jgi:uncharacterized protein (TIGR02145 family)